MQRVRQGLIMVNDPTTGSLYPWLQRTLAKLVIFPDGRDLWEHWKEEMADVNKATFRREQTYLGDNSFAWETNTFGTCNAVLKLHAAMSLPAQPGDNRYIYRITLPNKFIPTGRKANYEAASFSVFERENSTFIRNRCLHNVSINVEDEELQVIVDHLKEIDNVNLDTEPYITGSFDITCDISFNAYSSDNMTSAGGVPSGATHDSGIDLTGIMLQVDRLHRQVDDISEPD